MNQNKEAPVLKLVPGASEKGERFPAKGYEKHPKVNTYFFCSDTSACEMFFFSVCVVDC